MFFTTNPTIHCICCGSNKTKVLSKVEKKGRPHGKFLHKQQYSYKTIMACSACGCAQLEVYDHDCWDWEEPWDMYWWYGFQSDSVEALNNFLQDCPFRLLPQCPCGIHKFMRHELSQIYGGIKAAQAPDESKAFAWLRFDLNKEDNAVSISLDSSKAVTPFAP